MDRPFTKRIKRHIVGPKHTFFAATAPGLESLCRNEMMKLPAPIENVRTTPGGVEFEGRLYDSYTANLLLRIPNRILMRIASFKATNFRQLEKKIIQIPWELYVFPKSEFSFRITTKHSRLYHKAAIAERCEASIRKRLESRHIETQIPFSETDTHQIFIRTVDDRFSVSLDTSGDPLYKRGLKQDVGKAPIRETLAAAILMVTGFYGSIPLIDPMCGSGTFSLEAAMQAKNIPSGWHRRFAFMHWPSYNEKQWRYLKTQNAKCLSETSEPIIFASDKDQQRCRNLKDVAQRFGLDRALKVTSKNFFDLKPGDFTKQSGVVVLNPPFGIRIKCHRQSDKGYDDIFKKLKTDFKGWQVGILLNTKAVSKQMDLNLVRIPLYHGGLNLSLFVGRIP